MKSPHGVIPNTASFSDTCGKFRFVSMADARKSARQMRKRGAHVRPYLCSKCDMYHTGTLPPAVMSGRIPASALGPQ